MHEKRHSSNFIHTERGIEVALALAEKDWQTAEELSDRIGTTKATALTYLHQLKPFIEIHRGCPSSYRLVIPIKKAPSTESAQVA